EGQWLDAEASRPIEQLDARIEVHCRALGIPAPEHRSPPAGMAIEYFGFTQLPFWRGSIYGPGPAKRLFEPDEVWYGTMRRLADLAKEKARPTRKPARPSKGQAGRRGYSEKALEYARELRRKNPRLTAQVLRAKCLQKFEYHDVPQTPDNFRRWLNRPRKKTGRNRAK
ncbi:MAG TPA: hypothetical protein VKE94_22650, partial [Gemmataceae bacterium]|nr:hypothetical protein [Gemmataceae bacterium]